MGGWSPRISHFSSDLYTTVCYGCWKNSYFTLKLNEVKWCEHVLRKYNRIKWNYIRYSQGEMKSGLYNFVCMFYEKYRANTGFLLNFISMVLTTLFRPNSHHQAYILGWHCAREIIWNIVENYLSFCSRTPKISFFTKNTNLTILIILASKIDFKLFLLRFKNYWNIEKRVDIVTENLFWIF